ncbi:ARID DNA-binding domain-containing protein [Tanacetum coccineum]
MVDESRTYTVDDALAAVGFGKFQMLVLVYAGMGWISEAMEMMLLSFVGPALQSAWNLSSREESMITSVVFAGINDVQDYMDDEYISWNGSLYALKVNSFSRFLSFMDLMKKDSMVYKHWDIFSKKYVEMLKWFYLVHLNYGMLEGIPPVVGVMEINLLSLHKIVDSLGGYLCVTLGDKWKTVAGLQGLTEEDEEVIKECYKKFIDMVQVYYETAKKPWYERKPKEDVVESSSGDARIKDPQGKDKDEAGKALEEDMNNKSKFGVSLEGNSEEEAEEGSTTDSNDFEVIV